MDFSILRNAVQVQMKKMFQGDVFTTATDKEEIYNLYLSSFPEGTNKLYRERTEHDCNCCKSFIRQGGSIVSVVDGKLVSIWDVEVGGYYQVVADALSKYVKSKEISNFFLHSEGTLGTDFNFDTDTGAKWSHFFYRLPPAYANRKDIGTALAGFRGNKDVLKRSLEEISKDAIDTVVELINSKTLYRGEEHLPTVNKLKTVRNEYGMVDDDSKDIFCWNKSKKLGGVSRFRNTVIGTLLSDISDGVDLEDAVKKFESKVAPHNYKRPKALITKGMITKAQATVEALGIENSLFRRHSVQDDITVNNVLFIDRSVKKEMGIFDQLVSETKVSSSKERVVKELSIEQFVKDMLPKLDTFEVMLENKNVGNLMSLVSPVHADAPSILKWDNNFTWSYKGDVTDSMKERVKAAGGDVDGVLRFSIQWNDGDHNPNDFDAHCREPNGNLIFYSSPRSRFSGGRLDVDIIDPKVGKPAVENITWATKSKILEGKHTFLVDNFSYRGGRGGFTAEIEYEGKIYSYTYDKPLRNKEQVVVAECMFSRKDGLTFTKSLPSSESSRTEWGLATQQYHRVDMMMNSPNHWDDNKVGNKHWFFILKDCKTEESTRGFYNEYLSPKLNEHRKVFEVMGSKMKVEDTDEQLSGLGFSSTVRNSVLCRADNQVIKINF